MAQEPRRPLPGESRRPSIPGFAAALVLLLAASGCVEAPAAEAPDASGSGGTHTAFGAPVRLDEAVRPGGFLEINLEMRQGDRIHYEWTSGATLYFDIHWHRDRETHKAVVHRSDGASGTFAAPSHGVYSLFWSNERTEPVHVQALVEGAYEARSTHRS